MAKIRNGTRILIAVAGKSRQILSISEQPPKSKDAGDLYIRMMPAQNFSDSLEFERKKVRYQKYTIHSSNYSERINTIKMSLEFENGDNDYLYHNTEAIKVKTNFAPLFIRSYPDLSSDRYDVTETKDRTSVSLGEFEPSSFCLIVAVFVGPSDRKFNGMAIRDYSIRQLTFTKFSLVIMWCYMGPMPSTIGQVGHVSSEGIEDPILKEFRAELVNGFDESGCKDWFKTLRQRLHEDMRQFGQRFVNPLHPTRFFQDGNTTGASWRKYIRQAALPRDL